MLRHQLTALKIKNIKLKDEKKQDEQLIADLMDEIKKLKAEPIDISKYESWDHTQILLWILQISDDNGNNMFVKYENELQKQLKHQGLKGVNLKNLDKNDLMTFGIHNFGDRHVLYENIRVLINGGNGNDLNDVVLPDLPPDDANKITYM